MGVNLLDPGKNPSENIFFLTFFVAVIAAVDRYAELLRCAATNPGNDHRLGGHEAPPSIISVFIGESLEKMLLDLEA